MYKRSLLVKMLVWILLATVIPFICSNLISYRSTSAALEENLIELNRKTMNIGLDNLKRYLQELNQTSVSWYYDQSLISYMWLEKPGAEHTVYIDRQVDSLYYSRPEIKLVNYFSAMSGQQYVKLNPAVWGVSPQLKLPSRSQEDWGVLPSYETQRLNGSAFLIVHRKLIDYPKSTVLGLLSICFSMEEISRIGAQLLDQTHEQLFMLLGDGQMIYTSDETVDARSLGTSLRRSESGEPRGHWYGEFQGKPGVFLAVTDSYLGTPLTIVKFIPSSFINQTARQTLDRSIAIQFIAVAFVILFTFILTYSTIAPIKRLIRNMIRVEIGQFDVERFKTREDELGILELRFQTMVRNLKEMIIREYQQRIELSTAQLKMLQAQINPHFLYNTLQWIGTEALRHQIVEINDKISQLGAILRYSMDLDTETVTLQMEIDHIQDYLSLQETRFKDHLTYTIQCEPAAAQVLVPKMILQPLVENSIVHGIEDGSGQGSIWLDITLEDSLVIRIIDNGKGIDPSTIQHLKQRFEKELSPPGEQEGIGLINVLQRLRLKYREAFTWEIVSRPYEQTEIVLVISSQEGN
ncbi:sensor histidine kinase [Paenibacillus filicis]|uniref:Sensor histidine kinase n=2 Tax=Paenibacillus filicis TaxID=669464 RepID=A0ABU9DWC4_9BACL